MPSPVLVPAIWSGIWNSNGLRCGYAGDIATGQDALALDDYGQMRCDHYESAVHRDLMHRLIVHFQRHCANVAAMAQDFVSTLQAVPFLGIARISRRSAG